MRDKWGIHRHIGLGRLAVGAVAACMAIAVAAPPAAADGGQQGDPALRDALQAVVDAGATGMIALVDDGPTVSAVGVGAARLDPFEPISVRDQVRVGSITKTAISTITLQLAGEGRVRLDDSIETYLPGVVPSGSAITLRMLLNHTSGIFNYTDDADYFASILADPFRYRSPEELLAVAFAHPPLFAPGQGWSYSNTGYIVLGLMLEAVTHTPVQRLIERRVVHPLHLRNTYFATSGRFRGPYAHGYAPPEISEDGYLDVSAWNPSWAWAAGALVSNAPDLRRFYQALLSGRLLRPKLLRQMLTTVDTGMPGAGYGLGIFSLDTACGTVWGHDGGIPGYLSYALNDVAGKRSAILLLPTQPDSAIAAAFPLALATAVCDMFDLPVPAPPQTAAAAASSILRLAG